MRAVVTAAAMGVVLLAGTACPGPKTSGTRPATDGGGPDFGSFDLCAALSARAQRCGTTFDAAGCAMLRTCLTAIVQPQFLVAVEMCQAPMDCAGLAVDRCVGDLVRATPSTDASTGYMQACSTRRGDCVDAGQGFSDDQCDGSAVLFVQAFLAAKQDCFGRACGQVASCLQQASGVPACGP